MGAISLQHIAAVESGRPCTGPGLLHANSVLNSPILLMLCSGSSKTLYHQHDSRKAATLHRTAHQALGACWP